MRDNEIVILGDTESRNVYRVVSDHLVNLELGLSSHYTG